MDPITLIVTALAATIRVEVNERVQEAAESLISRLRRRFADDADAEAVLDNYERDPEAHRGPLSAKLAGSGAADDQTLIDAASRVLDLADPGSRGGSLHGSHGVQIGSYNTQANVFNSPPSWEGTRR